MKDSMIIQGFEYISARRAAEITKYSNDYIGQLCRKAKVSAKMIGRTWFVDKESLLKHQQEAEISKHLNGKNLVLAGDVFPTPKAAVSPKPLFQPTIGTYSVDNGPFMPVINKNAGGHGSDAFIVAEPVPEAVAAAETSFAAGSYGSIASPILAPMLDASRVQVSANSFLTRRTLVSGIVAVMLVTVAVGSVSFMQSNPSLAENNYPLANVYGAIGAIGGFFQNAYGATLALFGHTSALTLNVPSNTVSNSNNANPSVGQGMAVLPSTGSSDSDAAAQQQVRDTFSDQVTVQADKSGTAGVITPVFKDTAGKNFMYVLVPVKKTGAAQSGDQGSSATKAP